MLQSLRTFANRFAPKNKSSIPQPSSPLSSPLSSPSSKPDIIPNINEYIKEWLAIENIATKRFGQKYLVNYPNDADDPCEETVIDECDDNKRYKCRKYVSNSTNKNTCVSKDRIKKFQAPNTIVGRYSINSKTQYSIKFEMKESVLFNNCFFIKGRTFPMYYHIMLSTETNNVYILFPAGGIFEKDEFNKNPELKEFLQELVDKILEQEAYKMKKIIICGHSMGCVLALYTGMIMQKQDKDFFDNNVIIVGSAPFKYANDESFTNLKNVMVFVFALSRKGGNGWDLDSFVNEGPCEFNYKPITYVSNSTPEGDFDSTIINISEGGYDYLKFMTEEGSFYHRWENYQHVLYEIYVEPNYGGHGGRKLNKTKRQRRNKKRNAKKNKTQYKKNKK